MENEKIDLENWKEIILSNKLRIIGGGSHIGQEELVAIIEQLLKQKDQEFVKDLGKLENNIFDCRAKKENVQPENINIYYPDIEQLIEELKSKYNNGE